MRHLTKKTTTRLVTCLRLSILALGMIGALSLSGGRTAMAQCTNMLSDGNFEEQTRDFGDGKKRDSLYPPWHALGRAAIDPKRGLSYRDDNNAWAGKRTGWNAIFQDVRLAGNRDYKLTAFVHTSGDVRDGHLGFGKLGGGPILGDRKFGPYPAYTEVELRYRPEADGLYRVFIGFWALKPEAWIRVDLVRVETVGCVDVQ